MDAPLYPPSRHFVPPERLARVLNTTDASIAELMAIPEIWAMVVKAMPATAMIVNSPMMAPNVGNMSLRDLVAFGAMDGAALDGVDARLKALGPVR